MVPVTFLTVLVFALAGLRLLILIVKVLADRTPAPAAAPLVRMDPCLGPFVAVPVRAAVTARSAEGDLTALLVAGAIGQDRYHREIAALAASNVVRPLVQPPD